MSTRIQDRINAAAANVAGANSAPQVTQVNSNTLKTNASSGAGTIQDRIAAAAATVTGADSAPQVTQVNSNTLKTNASSGSITA